MENNRMVDFRYWAVKIAGLIAILAVLVLASAASAVKDQSATDDLKITVKGMEAKKNKEKKEAPTSAAPANSDPTKEKLEFNLAKDEIPEKKIYIGSTGSKVTDPRFIDYGELVRATPHYRKIRNGKGKEKVEPNSANYWLLISRGGDAVRREIIKYAAVHKITLVTDKENLIAFLKKQDLFKNVTDEEMEKLIRQFDITEPIRTVLLHSEL